MISALFPGFFAAGALLALGALGLHLLSRRPPERRPLPTARFLDEEHRTLLRIQQRPADVRLLVARTLFALVLGAALAAVSWAPDRNGTRRYVLVDVAGASLEGEGAMSAAIQAAVAEAESEGIEAEVVAYSFDEGGTVRTSSRPGELMPVPGARRVPAAVALRTLASHALEAADVDSAEVVWIVRPDWAQWTKGLGLMRSALWPGTIELRPVPETTAAVPAGGGATIRPGPNAGTRSAAPGAVRLSGFPPDAALRQALVALGLTASTDAGVSAEATATDVGWTFAENAAPEDLPTLVAQARAGRTVVLSGRWPESSLPSDADLPWWGPTGSGLVDAERVRVVLSSGREVGSAVVRSPGSSTEGSAVLALFEDLHPAASARRVGTGCLVYFAASLQEAGLTSAPAYVELTGDLIHACDSDSFDGQPLDAGARATLARSDLPNRVALDDLAAIRTDGARAGVSLTPLLLLLALALVGLESWLTRKRQP